ncbi:hypothetical protein HPULCUR_000945 [Helicostylum pulchrum]|uniref:Uncharacterized protein n=1 Tax=Helicostylum pulchrum TaxID=562976 RepID=A0ABP9XLC4_9FUNG
MTRYFKLLNTFWGTRYTYCLAEFTEPNQADSPDSRFNSIKIENWRDNPALMYQSLKYSFLNCPRVEICEVAYFESQFHEMVSIIKCKHKEEENPIGSDQTINLLEMEYITPVQHYFDFVTSYLKDIEFISFETLQWGLHNDTVVDLTGFKKLRSFAYITKGDNDSQESDFVLLKYTNGEEHCYYLDEQIRALIEYVGNPTITTTIPPCLTIFCDSSVSFTFKRD